MKKKILFMLLVLAVALPLSLSLQSCGDDDPVTDTNLPDGNTGNNGTGGGGDTGGNASDYGTLGANDYVATGSYTDLTKWSVKLLCSLNSSNLGDNIAVCTFGVIISEDESTLKEKGRFVTTSGVTGNHFEVSVNGLHPNTEYYYCACVSMSGVTRFFASETRKFKTPELALHTGDVTDITQTSAAFSLTLGENDDNIRGVGILLSATNETPTITGYNDLSFSATSEDGSNYTAKATNLSAETTYYYRAYIRTYNSYTNKYEYFYGEVKSFTTANWTINLQDATDITRTTATFKLTLGENNDDFSGIGILLSATDKTPTKNSSDVLSFSATSEGGGNYIVKATNLSEETTYYYRAYIRTYNYEYFYGKVKTFTTKGLNVAVSGAVDLGLSVKWAACNIGATTPEAYGDYYAWGETATKSDYSWSTYLKSLGATITSSSDCGTSKDPLRAYVYGGSSYNVATKAGVADGIGGTKYDVARVKLGGKWRMPTRQELDELRSNCTWTWITYKGKNGYLVESKTNGNSIFLPAAGCRYDTSLHYAGNDGYYWSSTPREGYSDGACRLDFLSDGYGWYGYGRYYGHSVRPVSE